MEWRSPPTGQTLGRDRSSDLMWSSWTRFLPIPVPCLPQRHAQGGKLRIVLGSHCMPHHQKGGHESLPRNFQKMSSSLSLMQTGLRAQPGTKNMGLWLDDREHSTQITYYQPPSSKIIFSIRRNCNNQICHKSLPQRKTTMVSWSRREDEGTHTFLTNFFCFQYLYFVSLNTTFSSLNMWC